RTCHAAPGPLARRKRRPAQRSVAAAPRVLSTASSAHRAARLAPRAHRRLPGPPTRRRSRRLTAPDGAAAATPPALSFSTRPSTRQRESSTLSFLDVTGQVRVTFVSTFTTPIQWIVTQLESVPAAPGRRAVVMLAAER